eukprot:7014280-Ditylum_brightwellii.AAC.1
MLSLACLTLTFLVQYIEGTNVSVSSSGIAVGALDSVGLATRVLPNGLTVMQSLPEGLTSISDVSIDENDIVFALYGQALDDPININPADIDPDPGGVAGLTHFVYNTESGMISQTSTSNLMLSVFGLPDVVMITPTTIAFSADFDLIDFGPLIATISDTVMEVCRFALNGTSGPNNFISPANFALVSDVTSTDKGIFLYTANGAMAVVDPTQDCTVTAIADGVPSGFQAVT